MLQFITQTNLPIQQSLAFCIAGNLDRKPTATIKRSAVISLSELSAIMRSVRVCEPLNIPNALM